MALLTGLNIDANVKESNGFTVLPAGKYKACIVGDELANNKANTGKILKLSLQVIEGAFSATVLTDNLNITNPSDVCQRIGQGTLKKICNLCGVNFPPQDTNGLMGKPMVITVTVEEFKSNNTDKILQSNHVKSYESANTAIPAQAQAPVGMTQGQSAPQQTANASGW